MPRQRIGKTPGRGGKKLFASQARSTNSEISMTSRRSAFTVDYDSIGTEFLISFWFAQELEDQAYSLRLAGASGVPSR